MGKQKQHRRSAKKKGGKKGEASGQNDETVEEMVKCTACGQLVQPEDTVACPIPECGRSFCTDKCAESCIIRCADPICPCPNRCRPCASGTTLEQLERRNQPRLSSVHTPYTKCDGCENQVCAQCFYFDVCSQCNKKVCFECIDSERCIINFCFGACNKCYCEECDEGFHTRTKRCTECTIEAKLSSESLQYNVVGGEMCSRDEWRGIVDEVVLEFAGESEEVLSTIAVLSSGLKSIASNNASLALAMFEAGIIVDRHEEVASKRDATNLTARIFRRTEQSNETITQRVAGIFQLYIKKDDQLISEFSKTNGCIASCVSERSEEDAWKMNDGSASAKKFCRLNRKLYLLSTQRMVLNRGVLCALLPDISAMLESFQMMEGLVSDSAILNLQTIHLDLMQDLYSRELCGYCLRLAPGGDETKRCGGCSAIRYCDAKCQALSWPVHRHHCQCMKLARRDYNERILEKKKFEAGLEKAFCGWPGEEYLDQSRA